MPGRAAPSLQRKQVLDCAQCAQLQVREPVGQGLMRLGLTQHIRRCGVGAACGPTKLHNGWRGIKWKHAAFLCLVVYKQYPGLLFHGSAGACFMGCAAPCRQAADGVMTKKSRLEPARVAGAQWASEVVQRLGACATVCAASTGASCSGDGEGFRKLMDATTAINASAKATGSTSKRLRCT